MAYSTLDGIASHPKVKLACVAEVDSERLDDVKRKYPEARIYQDWREMLRKEKHQIDAACVGTPGSYSLFTNRLLVCRLW